MARTRTLAATYVRWMAQRQIDGGASYLDLNVDEVSHDVDGRLAAMVWLVGVVGRCRPSRSRSTRRTPTVMEVGLDALDPGWAGGVPPLLNSAPPTASRSSTSRLATAPRSSCRRPARRCPAAPTDRLVRAIEMIEMAQGHGLALGDLHVDPLVIPIGVDAEAGYGLPRRGPPAA